MSNESTADRTPPSAPQEVTTPTPLSESERQELVADVQRRHADSAFARKHLELSEHPILRYEATIRALTSPTPEAPNTSAVDSLIEAFQRACEIALDTGTHEDESVARAKKERAILRNEIRARVLAVPAEAPSEDTKRLDWLESERPRVGQGEDNSVRLLSRRDGQCVVEASSYRAAIDTFRAWQDADCRAARSTPTEATNGE